MENRLLPRPPTYLVDYHGSIVVRIRCGNREYTIQQACGPVELPEDLPTDTPLVTLDAKVPGGPVIPTQVFDFEKREWVRYDESLYPIPQSEADPTGVDSVEREEEEESEEEEAEEVDAPVEEEAPPRPRAQPVLYGLDPVPLDEDLVEDAPDEVVEEEEDGDD